ncbi:hypothetical protein [Cryobacterium sp. MP_3.1]|uniref:hypothetical protein n=1 Tax=Cryobacterium sp. MP_3.1 TaxID=3071711 RepID=UPI002E0F4CEE
MAEGSAERNVLYARDEQVARLLSATGTSGITLDVPAILDESDRAKYEDNLASFIIDHPFLKGDHFANVVFRDYVRAWAISSAISGLYSSSRQEFLSTLPPAGPFFAHFLHSLSVESDSALGTIPEDLVDDAIHSFALGTDIGHTVYFHRDEIAVLVLHGDPQSGAEEGSLAFKVTDLSGVVVLRSPLARLLFVSSQSLILRGHEGNIDIGPEVSIVVQELEIEAKSLTAFGAIRRKRTTFNMISAGAVRHDGDLSVSAIPAGALSISWPDAWHQWKPMLIDMGIRDPRIDQATVSQVLLCLRRVITSFRSSMQDAPSVSADKMDRIIIGTNPVFVATLAVLEQLGVVSRESALFRVSLDSLAYYGVSWADLHGDDPVSTLKKLLAAVVGSPEFDSFKS